MNNAGYATYRYETLTLSVVPLRADNYSYIIHDAATRSTLVIDPSETHPLIECLESMGLGLDWILNTHHHNDHIEGNVGLKRRFQAKLAAPAYDIEKNRISGEPDLALKEGEDFRFGRYTFRVLSTPGHTLGHVSLFLQDAHWLFSGDTLFSLGCGRLFEGDAPMMRKSFRKLAELPNDTLVFCGHEYTLANAAFVGSILPRLEGFAEHVQGLRTRYQTEGSTIPARLGDEKRFNPFFLSEDERLAGFGSDADEVFRSVRAQKDSFR